MVAHFSASELAEATGGVWHNLSVSNNPWHARICTDSRQIQAGDIFLALCGEHFDGHDFIATVIRSGIVAIIGLKPAQDIFPIPYLTVQDTLIAFGQLAQYWRKQYRGILIAITGSYGKTSVRCMLASMFSQLGFSVSSTQKNFNNRIGVPQTLLAASLKTDVWLIECGISVCGEMQFLARITTPDITVFTGFACAHSEGLGNICTIIREKLYLSSAQQCWVALGSGVYQQIQDCTLSLPVNICSVDDGQNIHWSLQGCCLQLFYKQEQVSINLILPATHWAANMALAVMVVCRVSKYKYPLVAVTKSLHHWQGLAGRLQTLSGIAGCVLLDDSYNANPASMQAALKTLYSLSGRHFVILGDMTELGRQSKQEHITLIQSIAIVELDGVILVGEQMQLAQITVNSCNKLAIRCANNTAMAINMAYDWSLHAGDTVLIKASRSVRLDKVAQALRASA